MSIRNHKVFREITPLSSEDCFVVFNRHKSTFTFPIHLHHEYELNFIENAKGAKRIVGDSIETIDDLELCLIGNERLEHGWINGDCKSEQIHEITIQFHRDLFLESLLNKKQFVALAKMFEKAKRGIVFSHGTIEKVKSKLDALISNKDDFNSVIDLIMILHELSQDSEARTLCNFTFTSESDSSDSRRIQKAIEYLEKHSSEEIRLLDLANYVGMTEVSFSRFMKKATGKNFIHYLNDHRLGIASRLLVNTNKSIAEIAYECGFNNMSNFNRIFKKRKSITPKEFRENYMRMRKIV